MEVTQGAPFESFGLSEATMRAIRNKHYTVSTPVQAGPGVRIPQLPLSDRTPSIGGVFLCPFVYSFWFCFVVTSHFCRKRIFFKKAWM